MCHKLLHFNAISVINNDTFTNLSGDFGLQVILEELQTHSIKTVL